MFVLKKRVELGEFDKEWEGCYLTFNSPNFEQVRSVRGLKDEDDDKLFTFLKGIFIEGLAYDGKEKVTVKADDLVKLPTKIIVAVIQELIGDTVPKAPPLSTTQSSPTE